MHQLKNNPLEKILYFSNGRMSLSQTFTQSHFVYEYSHNILLRQLIRFNRYNS